MWLHLWLQGMLITHMNNPPVPYEPQYCQEQAAGIARGIVEESRRNGGLVVIAGVRHPVHHFALTCEPRVPVGTIRPQG